MSKSSMLPKKTMYEKDGTPVTLGLSELVLGDLEQLSNDMEPENSPEQEPLKIDECAVGTGSTGNSFQRKIKRTMKMQICLLVICILICCCVIGTWIYFALTKKEGVIPDIPNNEDDYKKWEYDGPCKISLPQKYQPLECKMLRENQIKKSRMFFKLTVLGEKEVIQFPLRAIPFLNQTMDAVKHFTILDPVDSRWLFLIQSTKSMIKEWQKELMKTLGKEQFNTFAQHQAVYMAHIQLLEGMNMYPQFSNPMLQKNQHIFDGTWISDDFFTKQRLFGLCPFLIKKVTLADDVGFNWMTLKKQLNPTFDFDNAVQEVIGITIEKVVQSGRLYVLYHEQNNNVKTEPHRFFKEDGDRYTANVTSPIALFVRTSTGDLKVVAIQYHYKPESPVYSPRSSIVDWLSAKAMVTLADMNYCQAVWHLSHVHFSTSVFCAIYRSHFSSLHPIYQIMRYHCEGTTPHITLAWPTLVAPGLEGQKLLSIGNNEFGRLAAEGYGKYSYGKLAYDELLKAHGLDSQEITYHPFRDDGYVIWWEFKMFAENFVSIFYKSDVDVHNDKELQSYANELSIEGSIPPYGGRGKVVGFPPSMQTREQLKTYITRFLWSIPMHAVVNYPLENLGTFVPMAPTKLYYDSSVSNSDNIASIYPDGPTTIGATSFAMLLGNLRVNRIMDYYDKVRDRRLINLVGYHYKRLHTNIQLLLEERNRERKSKGLMEYPYLEPKWLPNSVHV